MNAVFRKHLREKDYHRVFYLVWFRWHDNTGISVTTYHKGLFFEENCYVSTPFDLLLTKDENGLIMKPPFYYKTVVDMMVNMMGNKFFEYPLIEE
jgi:hypothetical protein